MRSSRYLTHEEKLERVRFYENNGPALTAEKYSLIYPAQAIHTYRRHLGISKQLSTEKKKQYSEIIEYHKLHGRLDTIRKFGISSYKMYRIILTRPSQDTSASMDYSEPIVNEIIGYESTHTLSETFDRYKDYFKTKTRMYAALRCIKTKFGIYKKKGRIEVSDEVKLEIIKYYVKHGSELTAIKYGYVKTSVSYICNRYAILLGYPRPLRIKKAKPSIISMDQKREIVEYYKVNGSYKTAEHYGYQIQSLANTIRIFAAECNIHLPRLKVYKFSDTLFNEMKKFKKNHSIEEFELKFGVAYSSFLRRLKQEQKDAM